MGTSTISAQNPELSTKVAGRARLGGRSIPACGTRTTARERSGFTVSSNVNNRERVCGPKEFRVPGLVGGRADLGKGAVPQADPEAEFLRLSNLLLERGVDLREIYSARLTHILGGNAFAATVLFLGDDAFSDPARMLSRIKRIFGSGTPVLLSGLVERASVAMKGGS
jgi:hypothetical protein